MTEITITGNILSKKNMLKMTRSGHGYYDAETRASLNDLSDQVSSQWFRTDRDGSRQPRSPLVHPAVAVQFYVVSGRSDADNKWTTLLDALVSGGVFKDDCIDFFNGGVMILSAIKTPSTAGAKVFIEESGDFDRLYSHVKHQDFNEYEWLKTARAERKAKAKKRLKRI